MPLRTNQSGIDCFARCIGCDISQQTDAPAARAAPAQPERVRISGDPCSSLPTIRLLTHSCLNSRKNGYTLARRHNHQLHELVHLVVTLHRILNISGCIPAQANQPHGSKKICPHDRCGHIGIENVKLAASFIPMTGCARRTAAGASMDTAA